MNMRRSVLCVSAALLLCLAIAPVLFFNDPPVAAQSEQGPLWSYQTGDDVLSVAISSDGSYVVAGSDKVYFIKRGQAPLPIRLWITVTVVAASVAVCVVLLAKKRMGRKAVRGQG